MGALSDVLTAAAPTKVRAGLSKVKGLERQLEDLLEVARGAWPSLRVSDEDFMRHVGARLPDDVEPAVALATLNVGDLFLACACGRGAPGAMVQLDRKYLSGLGAAVERSLRLPKGMADDVQQALREKLFLAQAGKPARILAYSGRGSLASWLRSAAIRTALNMRPSSTSQPLEDALLDSVKAPENQEMQVLKTRFRKEFKTAFEHAVGTMAHEDLEWLRLNLIEGMSIDKLGEVYGVSRATAARRLAVARKELMDLTKRRLAERLGLSSREVKSVVGLVRSQLDLSLYRCLGAPESD